MASPYPSTAEHLLASVEAVTVNGGLTDAAFVAAFADVPLSRAESALALATDIGFLKAVSATEYTSASHLCRFVASSLQQRSADALRIMLENFEPFVVFRARLANTTDPSTAGRHTKVKLGLVGHHDEIRDTLVSLGTFSHALKTVGGGQYELPQDAAVNELVRLAEACTEMTNAEARIRIQLGDEFADEPSATEVVQPLADSLLRAARGDGSGAVQQAGNAVEAFLIELAGRKGVNVATSHGINAKVEAIGNAVALPSKIKRISKYAGDIRNAADHGPDLEIGNASWSIRPETGTEYVFVACSLIRTLAIWELAQPPSL